MRKVAAGSGLRRKAGDAIEALFGPDPGLLRLQMAARSVLSTALSLTVLLLLMDGGFMPVAGIAIGFMVSLFGSMMVRQPGKTQQAITFLLLAVPPLPSVALASFLAQWQWAIDIGFIALVVGVTLARQAGPRGMAMGMTAYISYFMGAIIHPKMAQLPLIAMAVVVGAGSAALIRFLVLPDLPRFTLHKAARHIGRRVGRILDVVQANLSSNDAVRFGTRADNRLHREMARLNDAVLTAEGQAGSLPGAEDGPIDPLSDAFFRLDLAAERLIRAASSGPPPSPEREAAQRRVAALQARLGGDTPSVVPDGGSPPLPASTGRLGKVVDALDDALNGIERAIAAAEMQDNSPESQAAGKTTGQDAT